MVSTKLEGKPMSARAMRVRSSRDEKMIVLKGVVAARAHVEKYGLVVKQLDAVTHAFNCNPHLRIKIKSLAVEKPFNKMVKDFNVRKKKGRASFVLGGKHSPLEKMLSSIIEAM